MPVCLYVYVLVFKAVTSMLTQTFLPAHTTFGTRTLCSLTLLYVYHILYSPRPWGMSKGQKQNEVQTHKTVIKILNYTRMHLGT